MNKFALSSMMLALTVTFAGCGGGGSDAPSSSAPPSSNNNGGSGGTPPGAAKVAGPLDAVQEPVSQEVVAPLTSSFAGTPLQGVSVCVDQIVVGDVIDTLDVLALAVQSGVGSGNPQAALTAAAAGVQGQVENIVVDLQGMLSALNGKSTGCLGNTAPNGSNPLAGTPLAAVGATLAPVLQQVYGQLHGSGSTRPNLSMSTIASLVAQLQFGVNSAFAQVPSDVANAPFIGASLSTVQTAIGNINTTVAAAAARNTSATKTAIATTVSGVLSGVLLNVVPVTTIESQAGQPGMLSAPINTAIGQVSTQIGTNLGVVLQPLLEQNIDGVLSPVVDALNNSVLSAVLGPLFDELGNAGTSTSNPLGPVTTVLETFFDGASSAGNPLDLVLDVISGSSGCPLAGTPLAILCGS